MGARVSDHNNGNGTFTEVSKKAGVANEKGYYGFGVAFADLNDDGNRLGGGHRFGAELPVLEQGRRDFRRCELSFGICAERGGSYISNNDMRLHFGIGKAKQVDKVEVRWPDGTKENVTLPGVNRVFQIVEGKGATGEQLK